MTLIRFTIPSLSPNSKASSPKHWRKPENCISGGPWEMLQRLLILLFLAIIMKTMMTARRENGDYMEDEDDPKLKAASLATIHINRIQQGISCRLGWFLYSTHPGQSILMPLTSPCTITRRKSAAEVSQAKGNHALHFANFTRWPLKP